ncbi:MAG: peptidylprolyl isomerase, partial [Deltaproteobacteria bacterium]|nr:peptidylprolyl isomerase [Deltaproteobacteria bacterium]
ASADAYGDRDEARIMEVPRDQLPPNVEEGALLRAEVASGQLITLIVVELSDDKAKLDPNHPLAGKDLVFDVTIVKVEKATDDEIAHGHCH